MKRIVEQYKKVNESYQMLIELSNEKFHALKIKDYQQVEQINQKESMHSFDLTTNLSKLRDIIKDICVENQIEEFRLKNLLPSMSIEEKEEIMACQRRALHFQQELKNNIINNECLLEELMRKPSVLVESYMQLAREEKANGNSLYKKKL